MAPDPVKSTSTTAKACRKESGPKFPVELRSAPETRKSHSPRCDESPAASCDCCDASVQATPVASAELCVDE